MTINFAPVIKRPWLTAIVFSLFALLLAVGAKNLAFKNDNRVFFGPENPQLQAFEKMQETFAKSDDILFIIAPKNGDVFTQENIELIQFLTTESWQLPYSGRVESIANFQHTYAEEDDMIVEDLVSEEKTLDPATLQKVKDIALAEPLIAGRLVSHEAHSAAVHVTLNLPHIDQMVEVPKAKNAADALRLLALEKYPDVDIHLIGMVVMNATFSEVSINDSSTLIPIMFLIVVLLVGFLIRTVTGTLLSLVVIILSIVGALGFAGWVGIDLTAPSSSAPTMILTIAVADCVHILATLYHEMRQGQTKHQAILNSLKINFQPILLTSVTTALGFLSMNFSDSPPFRDLGNIVAAGVILACILSMTLFPALLSVLPLKASVKTSSNRSVMDNLAEFVIANSKAIFILCGLFVVAMVFQIPKNELNDNFVEYFDHSVPFRGAAEYSDENLVGLGLLEVGLNTGTTSGINNPAFLQHVDDFVHWLQQQPEVIHVNSFTETMKRLNMNMHGDDESYYRLPESQDLAAQYVLLYEMSLPYGLDLNNQLNIDKSATRIVVNLHNLSSQDMIAVEQRTRNWLAENAPELEADISSIALMFSHIGQRNIVSMLIGTTIALVLISFILMIVLRSFKHGLISLIPNLAPAAVAFGSWGLLVGEVGLALSVVTGMTLGIVVDDTVHFLSKYLYAKREKNLSAEDAIRYAFASVGKALWVTTVALAAGFFVLAQSSFKANADMGLLTAVTIIVALILDFLLLPALLLLLDKAKPKPQQA